MGPGSNRGLERGAKWSGEGGGRKRAGGGGSDHEAEDRGLRGRISDKQTSAVRGGLGRRDPPTWNGCKEESLEMQVLKRGEK